MAKNARRVQEGYPSDGRTASDSSEDESALDPNLDAREVGTTAQGAGRNGPPPGENYTLPTGQVIHPTAFGMSLDQFGILLTTLQGCLGSNNVQATPPAVAPW